MSISIREWWPFTYDQCWVECAKEIMIPTDIDSHILRENLKRKCGGKLWYRWDEIGKKTLDITCDRCVPSFHRDQLELFECN